ncbi:hypothetical protein [Sphingomonas sp. PB4P5]|uniref:hypothetical protein n=1 Tax=Parasphingomonas puruogangriensis TaxID=3096155 RepID=UPI002FCA342F
MAMFFVENRSLAPLPALGLLALLGDAIANLIGVELTERPAEVPVAMAMAGPIYSNPHIEVASSSSMVRQALT